MFDSTGKAPDGVLSDVTNLCDLGYRFAGGDPCPDPDLIPSIFEIPQGNAVAMGSLDGCYSVDSLDTTLSKGFKGRYIFSFMKPKKSDEADREEVEDEDVLRERLIKEIGRYDPAGRLMPGVGAWVGGILDGLPAGLDNLTVSSRSKEFVRFHC